MTPSASAATDSSVAFEHAYSQMIRDPELFDMIVHMDSMYAAAVNDLVQAKETTMTRRRATILRHKERNEERRRRRQQAQAADATVEGDRRSYRSATDDSNDDEQGLRENIGGAKNELDESVEDTVSPASSSPTDVSLPDTSDFDGLVRQYEDEIAQTKRDQRLEFREFVLTQFKDYKYTDGADAAAEIHVEPALGHQQTLKTPQPDSTTRAHGATTTNSHIPAAVTRRRMTKLKPVMLDVLVRQGFPL